MGFLNNELQNVVSGKESGISTIMSIKYLDNEMKPECDSASQPMQPLYASKRDQLEWIY